MVVEVKETLSTNELLVLAAEEAGEVVQAATKCLRFGIDHTQPNYGHNKTVLSQELGDLMGVMDALGIVPDEQKRQAKIERAIHAKRCVAALKKKEEAKAKHEASS